MTRDSNGWWWLMGAAIVTALMSDTSIVNDLVPDHMEKAAHAIVKLLSILVATGAGLARMSPLPISPEGRQTAMAKKSERLEVASIVASVASEKATAAVQATTEAAAASEMAKDMSKKAAGS